ncbi:MAG: MTH1187 family thiamine-binding protein [Methanomicrobiales archaeon]
MISAEITIIPIGTGETSLSDYVAAAVAAIKEKGVKYKISGLGTILESDNPQEIFDAVQAAHEAVFLKGSNRVATNIIIDDRRDADKTYNEKISSVKEKIGE